MRKPIYLVYGIFCYVVSMATIFYAALFFGNIYAPRTIDVFGAMPAGKALLINTALIAGFALQHSGMARLGCRRVLARIVGNCMVRSTYVLLSSFAIIVLMVLWQPIGSLVWTVEVHFEMFGLRQAWTAYHGETCPEPEFQTPGAYRHVRHPIHLGWLIVLWTTPTMTVTHLLLAIGMSLYILIGTHLEEMGLMARFENYAQYMRKVPMLIPSLRRRLATTGDE
jgi:protein-S-isoprenylcysteine O-methyltransferase Ste14